MNNKDHAVFQSLGRVNRFGLIHAARFPAGSIAATDFARGSQLGTEISPDDFEPGTTASASTGAKAHLIAEIWDDLKVISSTARTIAKKEPGFATDFTLGDDTEREIISTAAAFLKQFETPATVAKFVSYLLPADFATTLQTDLTAIVGKGGEQTDDRAEDVGATARNRTLIKESRALIGSLNTSVRNLFRSDPEVLAEWRAAARIHKTGGSAAEPTAPPAVVPA